MEIGKQELDRTFKEEVKRAFKRASAFGDINQTPGRAAGAMALITGVSGVLVTAIAASITNHGYTALAVSLAAVLFNARRTYERQEAVQEAYRSLPAALREDAPDATITPK